MYFGHCTEEVVLCVSSTFPLGRPKKEYEERTDIWDMLYLYLLRLHLLHLPLI